VTAMHSSVAEKASRWWKPATVVLVVVIGLAVLPFTGSQYRVYLNSQVLFMILAAVSLNILVGYTGLFSYGHVAFFGVGAYTFAILTKTVHADFWFAFLAAPVVAGLFALAASYFCVRLTAIYFSFLTLAVAQICWAVAYKWIGLTGGDSGMPGVAIPTFLASPRATYYFIATVVAILVLVIHKVMHSPFGLMLNVMRENPNRALFIGVNIKKAQIVAFTLAGLMAGFAGVLFVINTRSIFPNVMLVTRSIDLVIMCVLGGMYHFWGPALGAVIIVYLNDVIKARTEYWPLVLGLLIAVVVLAMPTGVTGVAEKTRDRLRSWWARRHGRFLASDEGSR
jgi:branched-chain amino acid transport system permease protein